MGNQNRVESVDVMRACTMFLMVFVNDLPTNTGVPEWLLHAKYGEDRLGFSDVIFPLFLFLVGVSIPFAMLAREARGRSRWATARHIGVRASALIIMGLFMVNREMANQDLMPLSLHAWRMCMLVAFVLVWNHYRSDKVFGHVPRWVMQLTGVTMLLALSLVYGSGSPDDPHGMGIHWWGILGLIGWSYFFVSLAHLGLKGRPATMTALLLLAALLNVHEHSDWFDTLPKVSLIVGASNHVLVLGGVAASLLYLRHDERVGYRTFISIMVALGAVFLAIGMLTRSQWGISKIAGTPSWVAICLGLGFIGFGAFHWLVDVRSQRKWARFLMPAGRSSLTCYLVPGFLYSLFGLLSIQLPGVLTEGYLGLTKSFLFAILVVGITGRLEHLRVRLKV